MYVFYFEKMKVWQNARELTNLVYDVTRKFPKEEEFHLKYQMRRCSSSIKSNISEGQGRQSIKDQIHYTNMSYASLLELLNHLITAKDQRYIDNTEYSRVRGKIEHISNQLIRLRKTQSQKLEQKN